jgi:hypothetical protein
MRVDPSIRKRFGLDKNPSGVKHATAESTTALVQCWKTEEPPARIRKELDDLKAMYARKRQREARAAEEAATSQATDQSSPLGRRRRQSSE